MKNIENSRAKLYRIVAIFVLLGMALGAVAYFGGKIQSGNRAYISGESEWSKAQKEASINLLQYVRTEDERYYASYLQSFKVISGYRDSREELFKAVPDIDRAREGFIQGNNHPEDVEAMIWLVQNFGSLDQIQNALVIWEEADRIVRKSALLAGEIHQQIQKGDLSEAEKEEYLNQVIGFNERLTVAGQSFSEAMSSSARRFGEIIFWLNVLLSTTFIFFAAYYSVSYMRNLRGANAKLFRSEYKFRNVLSHSRDVIYQVNIGSDKYDYMSGSVKDMLGFDAEKVREGGPEMILQRVHPEDRDRMKKRQEQNHSANVEQTMVQDSEFRVKRADGTYIWVNNKRAIVHDSDGNPAAIVGNVRDITDQKQQMQKLDQSLAEKQTLLAEIHHRVKNNLAIVSSLIELQKDGVSPNVQDDFSDVQSRIKSIALIHEKLYQSTIFSEVELSEYIKQLADMISDTFQSKDKEINFVFNLEDIKVEMTLAVPVGLICNELINNSFKHAFTDQPSGEIQITLSQSGAEAVLQVSDNGSGLPAGFSLSKTGGLGVTLLNVLTEQINGDLKVKDGSQTAFELTFPVEDEKGKAEQPTV